MISSKMTAYSRSIHVSFSDYRRYTRSFGFHFENARPDLAGEWSCTYLNNNRAQQVSFQVGLEGYHVSQYRCLVCSKSLGRYSSPVGESVELPCKGCESASQCCHDFFLGSSLSLKTASVASVHHDNGGSSSG